MKGFYIYHYFKHKIRKYGHTAKHLRGFSFSLKRKRMEKKAQKECFRMIHKHVIWLKTKPPKTSIIVLRSGDGKNTKYFKEFPWRDD